MSESIDHRAQKLLKVLIESYISEGKPVGSRSLARESGLDLSAATVRNVMSDLEYHGFLTSPHTSAGRIPTAAGYRFFVDSLLTVQPMEGPMLDSLRQQIGMVEGGADAILKSVSDTLSGLSHMVGLVTLPRRDLVMMRHVEFLSLPDRRVLAILVINEQEVQNHIIETKRDYSESELQQAANYLNHCFAGNELSAVRDAIKTEMRDTKANLDAMMEAVIEMGGQLFSKNEDDKDGYVIAGETNLMEFDDLSDVEKLRGLFHAFQEKSSILYLLEQCLSTDGVQIFIGEESGQKALNDCSLITAPYEADGEILGVLGVIGPTRMAYERVIPLVDVTAKLLGSALNNKR